MLAVEVDMVADILANMVADMEVNMVADMVSNTVADMKVHKVATIWWESWSRGIFNLAQTFLTWGLPPACAYSKL